MKSYTIPLSLLGAALVLAGALAYLLDPEAAPVAAANAGIGVVMVVAAGVANPELFRSYGRWIAAFSGSLMVLGIVVMVNFLAHRYPHRVDMTEGRLHSLADLTVQTLAGLESDVRALGFMEEGRNEQLEALLKEYAVHGSRFSYELIDPDRDPERAAAYAVRQYNTLVLECGDRQQKVTDLQEKEITSALLKVLRDRREVVYLTVGHGESGVGGGDRSLGALVERLKEYDYSVEDSLFLARQGEVPADCSLLVIAGPQARFLSNELEALERYLDRGGALLVMLDPLYETGLAELLEGRGVRVGDDFVIDTSGIGSLFGLDFTTPVAVAYGNHPIVAKHDGVMTCYQLCRSVRFAGEPGSGSSGVDLVLTSEQGWAESDLSVLQVKGRGTVRLDEGVDQPGPVSLAAVAEDAAGADGVGWRLVVFGDSDFATDSFFNYQGNGDLVLNAISWLAEDESLISIRPREAGENPITLTENQSEWVFWITVVMIPAAIALVGVLVVSRKGRWSLADLVAAGIGVALSVGVVALLNFVADRYHHRFDLTAEGLFTLDTRTHELMASLARDGQYVSVKAFAGEMEGMRFRDVLDEYRYLSRNFDYEILDPQKNQLQVRQYGVRERGTSIIEVSGGGSVRVERIAEQSEEALTNAIMQALRSRDQRVYFTGGHGEADLEQVDGEGYSILKGRLREMNLEVADGLDLGIPVPDDAAVVVALAPKTPFSADEADRLRQFLAAGGKALFLLDPGGQTGLEALLEEYSIDLGQDFVVDLSGIGQLFGADVSVPVVLDYADHPAVGRVSRGVMSFFPLARSVSVASDRRPGSEVTSLASTHRSSWGETDLGPLSGGGDVGFDPAADRRGPVSLAVAVKADADTTFDTDDKTRLVVFGDSDFASNQYFGQQANGELLAGSLGWLVEGDDRLSIPAREPRFNPINMASHQGGPLLWLSVFVLPFAVALSGMVMVLRRGYDTYAQGMASWILFVLAANAVFFFGTAVVRISEGSWIPGQVELAMSLLCAAAAYGLHRRTPWSWAASVALSVTSAVSGFWVIPNETIQLLYAAVFVANAAILVWIRRAFEE